MSIVATISATDWFQYQQLNKPKARPTDKAMRMKYCNKIMEYSKKESVHCNSQQHKEGKLYLVRDLQEQFQGKFSSSKFQLLSDHELR